MNELSKMLLGNASEFFRIHEKDTRSILLFVDLLPRLRWSALPLDMLQRSIPQLLTTLPSLFTKNHQSSILDSLAASLALINRRPLTDPLLSQRTLAQLFDSIVSDCSKLIHIVKDKSLNTTSPEDEDSDNDSEDDELGNYRIVPRLNEHNRLKEIGCIGPVSQDLSELKLHTKRLAHLLLFANPLSHTSTLVTLFLDVLQSVSDGHFPLHSSVLRHIIQCQIILLRLIQSEHSQQTIQAQGLLFFSFWLFTFVLFF